MSYLINNGVGYLKDAVQTVSNVKSYLINKTGYIVDNIRIGYQDFGTRVLDDSGIIESYSCVSSVILNSPTADAGRLLFESYDIRVESLGGSTEARTCTINELNEIL